MKSSSLVGMTIAEQFSQGALSELPGSTCTWCYHIVLLSCHCFPGWLFVDRNFVTMACGCYPCLVCNVKAASLACRQVMNVTCTLVYPCPLQQLSSTSPLLRP